MPRRRALTGAQLAGLLALPATEAELARHWVLGDADLASVGRRRRDHNRLGFALQLCVLRYPGRPLRPGEVVPEPALRFVAEQIGAASEAVAAYGTRVQTRSAHLDELREAFGFADLTPARRRELAAWLLPVALATTSAVAVAAALLEETRRRRLIVPGSSVVEELTAAALTAAERHVARQITGRITPSQADALDALLAAEPGTGTSVLAWARQARRGTAPSRASSRRWSGCRGSASIPPVPRASTPSACAGSRARAGALPPSTCAHCRRSGAGPRSPPRCSIRPLG